MDIRPIIEDLEYLKSVYGDCPAEVALDMLKIDALRRIAKALESNASRGEVCVARDHVAYFTTCEHDEQQEQKAEQALTYREFVKDFNALGQGHHASHQSFGGAVVVDLDGSLEAELDPNDCSWSLYTSARGHLRYDELTLMAKLAKTPPELRGGFNDGEEK